jgi:hypothetical protein
VIYSLYTNGVSATGQYLPFAEALESCTWRFDGTIADALTS